MLPRPWPHVIVLGVIVAGLAICSSGRERRPPRIPYAPRYEELFPHPTPTASALTDADAILQLAFSRVGGGHVTTVRVAYVAADGTMDPTDGAVEVLTGAPPVRPSSDPARRLGAPVLVRDEPDQRYPGFTWERGGVLVDSPWALRLHEPALVRPRCTVKEIWRRAISAGAPRAALASLHLEAAPQRWVFSIEDQPRAISFHQELDDDCGPEAALLHEDPRR